MGAIQNALGRRGSWSKRYIQIKFLFLSLLHIHFIVFMNYM